MSATPLKGVLVAATDPTGNFVAVASRTHPLRVFETKGDDPVDGSAKASFLCEAGGSESTHAVTDVAWSHPALGPLVATCGTDQVVQVYKLGWVKGAPQLSVLGQDSSVVPIVYRVKHDTPLVIAFPTEWRDCFSLAVGTEKGFVFLLDSTPSKAGMRLVDGFQFAAAEVISQSVSASVTALTWRPSSYEKRNILAVGLSTGHCAIVRFTGSKPTQVLCSLPALERGVRSVTWRPSLGRRNQYIAALSDSMLLIVCFETNLLTTGESFSHGSVFSHDVVGGARTSWSTDGGFLAVSVANGRTLLFSLDPLSESTWSFREL